MKSRQRFDCSLRRAHHGGTVQAQLTQLLIHQKDGCQVTLEEMREFLDGEAQDFIQSCRGGCQAGNTTQRIGTHGALAGSFHNKRVLDDPCRLVGNRSDQTQFGA